MKKILFVIAFLSSLPLLAHAQRPQIAVISLDPNVSNPHFYVDIPDLIFEAGDEPRIFWHCTVKANGVAIKEFSTTTAIGASNPQGNYNYTTNVPNVKLTTTCKRGMSILIRE